MDGLQAWIRGAALWAAGMMALGAAPPVWADDARIRVVDVGNGLCVVGRTPDGHSFLYDAGDTGTQCLQAVKALIPEQTIDVVVLSHSDADHIGELPEILKARKAGLIVYPEDYHRDLTDSIRREISAIDASGARVWSLKHRLLKDASRVERTIPIGQGRLTIVSGGYDPEPF